MILTQGFQEVTFTSALDLSLIRSFILKTSDSDDIILNWSYSILDSEVGKVQLIGFDDPIPAGAYIASARGKDGRMLANWEVQVVE